MSIVFSTIMALSLRLEGNIFSVIDLDSDLFFKAPCLEDSPIVLLDPLNGFIIAYFEVWAHN